MKKLVMRVAGAAVLVLVIQALPAAALPGTAASSGPSSARDGLIPAAGVAAAPRGDAKKRYRVRPGVTFNDPYTAPLAIRNTMLGAINHARPGATIRIMSWSFYDSLITDALIRAYRRGAVVQLFMARALSVEDDAGSNYRRLRAALSDKSHAAKGTRSWARTCSNSCRGRGGAMHSKWMTISRSGASRDVVMQGSANLNIRAAVDQWNDWFTLVGNEKVYNAFQRIFEQSKKDRRAPAMTVRAGKLTYFFAPRKMDPVLSLLDDVRCQGAEAPSGRGGTTVIRIASAVIYGNRGEAIASRLKQLHTRGCDVRLLYTLAPPPVRQILAGVPYRHLAFDGNGDGLFDDYLHMKAMSISGRVGRDRTASIVYNGSANWSKFGMISDEQGMTSDGRRRLAMRYIRWIDTIYDKAAPPQSARTSAPTTTARARGIDPYANVELEMRDRGR